jgi:hypothetical protein
MRGHCECGEALAMVCYGEGREEAGGDRDEADALTVGLSAAVDLAQCP